MKIIDLLNKIANGEEVPKHIKHCGEVYSIIYFENTNGIDYEDEESGYLLFADKIIINERLNDEVEILEEEKKIPEKLTVQDLLDLDTGSLLKRIVDNQNEIIDYLKSKGDE